MLERRRFFGESSVIKDNVMVWKYDDPGSDTTLGLFSTNFWDQNGNEVPFTTYLDGVSQGQTNSVTLTAGSSHIVEVQWIGDIYQLDNDFIVWLSSGPLYTLDMSRMDFKQPIALSLQGAVRLKQLTLNNLNLNSLYGVKLGVANSTFCKVIIKNTTFAGSPWINLDICGEIELEKVIFTIPENSSWAVPISIPDYCSSIIDLSTCVFDGNIQKIFLSHNNSEYLKTVYLNVDPSKITIQDEPWSFSGDGSQTLYYNQNYDSTVFEALFPGWNLEPIGLGETTIEWTPSSLNLEAPSSIDAYTTSITVTYTVTWTSNIGSTRTETGTYNYLTSINDTGSDVTKLISYSIYGLTATHTFVHKAEILISGSIARESIMAGDIFVVGSDGSVGNFRGTVPSGCTPIGVWVIPPSHDVYTNGKGAIVSLKAMHYNNSSGSTTPLKMYPGAERLAPTINRTYAYGRINNQSSSYSDVYENDTLINNGWAFASDLFLGQSNCTVCFNDSNSAYYSSNGDSLEYVLPSPYLSDGSRNTSYSSDPYTIIRFDGETITGYKLINGANNNTYSGEPIAYACSRYNVYKNSWYIPDLGEVGYLAARLKTIRNSFTTLKNLGYDVADLTTGYEIYSYANGQLSDTGIISCQYSTYRSDYHARYFDWTTGRIKHGRYNSYKFASHAFLQV